MTDLPDTVPYCHIDAFADRPFTGNQAAVMPLAAWPDDAVLQSIGEENNFAETAFIVPIDSAEADYELRWFTPVAEVAMCGHATLASGHYVFEQGFSGDTVRFLTRKAGVLSVSRDGDRLSLSLPALPPAPAPVPDWQRPGDPRGAITLRHLLHMSSGLQHTEAGDPPYESDEVRMLFLDGRDNMVRYAEGQPLEAEPGSKFEYSTNTSVILSDIITRQLTDSKDPDVRRRAMLEYMRGRLIEPLGMTSMVPEFDASGTLIGGSIIQANARDWAKFGEFLRNKGSIAGNQFLTRGWVDFMLTSSPNDPAYGGHIWLNKPRAAGLKKVLYPDLLPGDVFAAQGHLGQFVIVSPSQKLTLVRLGKTQDDVLDPVKEQLGRILALFPRD